MTKEKQEQMALILITFAALGLAGYHLVLKPGIAGLGRANEEIEKKRNEIAAMSGNIRRIPKLEIACNGLAVVLSNEESRLVGSGKYYEFLGLINNCATNAGMPAAQQQTLSGEKTIKRGNYYAESWVTMVCSPQYHSFGKWLAEIEANPYVRIVTFSINSTEADGGFHSAGDLIIGFLVKQGEK